MIGRTYTAICGAEKKCSGICSKILEKALGIKLPIILDSPSGKEVDQANIQLMVDILKRDFSGNQIIIASIFRYDFDEVNTIEIVNRLME